MTFWFVLFCLFLSYFSKRPLYMDTKGIIFRHFRANWQKTGPKGPKGKICSWVHCFVVCFIFAVATAAASAVILLLIVVVCLFVFLLLAGSWKRFKFCSASLQTSSFLDALTDYYQHLKNRLHQHYNNKDIRQINFLFRYQIMFWAGFPNCSSSYQINSL